MLTRALRQAYERAELAGKTASGNANIVWYKGLYHKGYQQSSHVYVHSLCLCIVLKTMPRFKNYATVSTAERGYETSIAPQHLQTFAKVLARVQLPRLRMIRWSQHVDIDLQ